MRSRLLLSTALLAALAVCAMLVAGPRAQDSTVSNYRSWTRITPSRVRMPDRLSLLCARLNPSQQAVTKQDPHKAWFNVFVNNVGKQRMLSSSSRKAFPVATVIVKEKFASQSGGEPELLTVMVKHASGYDNANGNWEFAIFDGGGHKTKSDGSSCQRCHQDVKSQDFVYGSY